MRIVDETINVELNHSCLEILGDSGQEKVFIADNEKENISIFSVDGKVISELHLSGKFGLCSFNHKKRIICYLSHDGIHVITYDKQELGFINGEFCAVQILKSEIWAVQRVNAENVKIKVFNIHSIKLVAEQNLEDIFYNSSYWLHIGIDQNTVNIWVGGGQDGQINLLAKKENDKIVLEEFGEFYDRPLEMNLAKTECLTYNNNSVKLYSFPKLKLNYIFNIDENYSIDQALFLSDNQILIKLYDEVKVFTKDLERMESVNIFKAKKSIELKKLNEVLTCKEIYRIFKFGNKVLLVTKDKTIYLANNSIFGFRQKNQIELPF